MQTESTRVSFWRRTLRTFRLANAFCECVGGGFAPVGSILKVQAAASRFDAAEDGFFGMSASNFRNPVVLAVAGVLLIGTVGGGYALLSRSDAASGVPALDRYVTPADFRWFYEIGMALGFRHVESGPLVRSSYHAWEQVQAAGV